MAASRHRRGMGRAGLGAEQVAVGLAQGAVGRRGTGMLTRVRERLDVDTISGAGPLAAGNGHGRPGPRRAAAIDPAIKEAKEQLLELVRKYHQLNEPAPFEPGRSRVLSSWAVIHADARM